MLRACYHFLIFNATYFVHCALDALEKNKNTWRCQVFLLLVVSNYCSYCLPYSAVAGAGAVSPGVVVSAAGAGAVSVAAGAGAGVAAGVGAVQPSGS